MLDAIILIISYINKLNENIQSVDPVLQGKVKIY